MNNKPSSKKTILVIIGIAVVAAIVYFYFSGSKAPPSTSLLQSSPNAASQAVGARVLSLLSQISSLRINTSIFQDPVYRTLVDFSVPIPSENVGRPNPFAPLPGFPIVPPPKK